MIQRNPLLKKFFRRKYVSGYACKGNQPTGAVVDLFNDLVNCADESTGATAKSICTKLLMQTVKRDISAVEASFELSRIPLYRCSHTFQNVCLSGCRLLNCNNEDKFVTKNTALDRYLQRDEKDMSSFYGFVCKNGKVPVITGNIQATWPLDENYCRTMLILHFPNWRTISDIKNDNISWIDCMNSFLISDNCPNFLKADVEKAKQNFNVDNLDDPVENQFENEMPQQPEWMELIKPNPNYEEIDESKFKYDDGGPEYDWGLTSHHYPSDLGINWLNNLDSYINTDDTDLDIPNVDITKMNRDQQFAFQIALKTIQTIIEHPTNYEPLRMIVSGTAGSGKSYLIKCLVKAVRTILSSNRAVQVLCPTGNSANIISGETLHSFLRIPIHKKGQ